MCCYNSSLLVLVRDVLIIGVVCVLTLCSLCMGVSVCESAGFGGRDTASREMTAPSGMCGTHGAVTVADGRQT